MGPESWHTWLILGGRGAGKTRTGAEWVRAKVLGQDWAVSLEAGSCSRRILALPVVEHLQFGRRPQEIEPSPLKKHDQSCRLLKNRECCAFGQLAGDSGVTSVRQHRTYDRIHMDGFAEGPVPDAVYGDVAGGGAAGFGRAADFENHVAALIDQINRRRTGRIFLEHLQHVGGGNRIMIRPASLYNSQIGTWPGRTADAYARGQRVQDGRGTGQGTSVTISFDSRARCEFEGPPDAVLLHELIHAIRTITGTQHVLPMQLYDRFEEFLAVTLTNLYLSEIRHPLRQGHGCDQMIPDVARFRQIYSLALERIDRDHRNAPLFQRLRALPASTVPWNPFVPFAHIDLVDGEPAARDPFIRRFQRALPDAILATSLADGIQAILGRLGPHGRIGRLRIIGHGTDGMQGVVRSRNAWSATIIQLEDGHIRGERALQRLTGRLGPGSWVELHGCAVAGDGGALIRALAILWRVPVKASLDTQFSGGGLEGRVSVAWPDGRFEERSSDQAPGTFH